MGPSAPEIDDRDGLAGRKHIVIDVDCFRKPALEYVGVGEKIVRVRISGIEREGGGEIAFCFGKMIAATVDVARENEKRGAVRQAGSRYGKFFKRAIVIAETPEEIIGPREMRFG